MATPKHVAEALSRERFRVAEINSERERDRLFIQRVEMWEKAEAFLESFETRKKELNAEIARREEACKTLAASEAIAQGRRDVAAREASELESRLSSLQREVVVQQTKRDELMAEINSILAKHTTPA